MASERFFKDPRLPWAECRYSQGSSRPYKAHMHPTVSVGCILHGEVRYTIESEERTLRPGSLATINPETLHACNPVGGSRDYYMLYLDPDHCLRLQEAMWDVREFQPFTLSRIDNALLCERFCSIMALLIDPQVHLLEKEEQLSALLSEIFRCACAPRAEREQPEGTVDRMKALLAGALDEDLSLSDLAERLEGNPYTLLRRFKEATGITPHAYRTNCRVDLAKRYLREGMQISDVAVACGFFDQSHLHRNFKALTTVTPWEYRVNFVQ